VRGPGKPPKLPEGHRLDLTSEPDAPALRRPDGVVVARFSPRGMMYAVVEQEALEVLLYTSQEPRGIEPQAHGRLKWPRPT
jgi:hypothetical protein